MLKVSQDSSVSGTPAPPGNSFCPWPTTSGWTSKCSSSKRPCSSSQRTSVALPVMPSWRSCLSRVISAATSPLTTLEFSQAGSVSVVETTYLRAPFICAVAGSAGSAPGQ